VIRNLLDPPDGHTLAAILQHELERADGLERGLSLAFIDIDRFTQFNSAHGWDRGNQVLEAIASVLTRISGHPAAGWIGGDAFALVIAAVSALEAAQATSRTSTVIRDVARINGICRKEIAISVGGITAYQRCTVREIMRAAYDQLMMAKRAGGDRVEWNVHVPPENNVVVPCEFGRGIRPTTP
jgi:diguanylate cyclase (GGDEF)-like protein